MSALRFTGSVVPPWIAEVELILKFSDELVLQRRTAREAKAILGPWFKLKISEYIALNIRTPGHENREQLMASCLYQTGFILDEYVLRAALKNGLVIAEESWFQFCDNREGCPPSYRYNWISNEDPYERFRRLDKRVRDNQQHMYEMSKRYPSSSASIPVATPVWKPKRPKTQPSELPEEQ